MLNIEQWKLASLSSLLRITGRQVIGVQVGSDQLRLDPENRLVMVNGFGVGVQRFLVFEVTDVMTNEGILLTGKRKSVL